MISRLAGIIANELNNWLSIISGHASSIADHLLPRTREHEDSLTIIDAVKHAEALAKRLMTISKAGIDDSAQDCGIINTANIVNEAVSLTKETFAENNIIIEFKESKSPSFVSANPDQLIDCIMHLLFNATDAMQNGGNITVDIINKRHKDKDYVVIRIVDTGMGIPKKIIKDIFTPFFTTKNTKSSIGLGLTVVQSSIHKWNGFIKVSSRMNKGTVFSIFLPAAANTIDKNREKLGTGGETILVVDNNMDTLSNIKKVLTDADYKVHTTNTGKDAISFFNKNSKTIDAVIIDLIMPGTDGKSVLTKILQKEPSINVVIISGFSKDYARGYLERGAWGFVQKPIDPTQLLNVLRRTISPKSDRDTTIQEA